MVAFVCQAPSILRAQESAGQVVVIPNSVQAAPAEAPPKGDSKISGTVIALPGGRPLAKASVVLAPENGMVQGGPNSTISDAQGNFAFSGIAAGRYRLLASRTGYISRAANSGVVVSVDAGAQVSGVRVQMLQAAVITGVVTDQDGDPVQDAQVMAEQFIYELGTRRLETVKLASTDDRGHFRLFGLRPGKYYVAANPVGLEAGQRMLVQGGETAGNGGTAQNAAQYVRTYYPGERAFGRALQVSVGAGAEVPADFELARAHTVSVSGRVNLPRSRTAEDEGVGAMVVLTQRDDPFGIPNFAQVENGEFVFDHVPEGNYELEAVGDFGSAPKYDARDLVVGADDVKGLVLTPVAPPTLQGRIVCDCPQAVDFSKLAVMMRPIGDVPARGPFADSGHLAKVRKDGSFEVKGIAPGRYYPLLTETSSGFEDWYTKSVTYGGGDATRTGVLVGPGGGSLQIVASPAGATITGIVKDANGTPLSGVTVVAVPPSEDALRVDMFQQATTDQNGVFTMPGVEPATYQLFAWRGLGENSATNPELLQQYAGQAKSLTVIEQQEARIELAPIELNEAGQQ